MDIQSVLTELAYFIGNTLIYFAMGIAFLFFVWNAFQYFILGGDSKDGREKARNFALWGILGFVAVASLWGVIRVLRSDLGIDTNTPIVPDYMQERTTTDSNSPFDKSGETSGSQKTPSTETTKNSI